MSAIDKWAKAHGTTGAQMTALLKSEYDRLGRTDPLLENILKEDAVISDGLSSALSAMLERARSGDITVSITAIASVFDVSVDAIVNILNEDKDGLYQNAVCDASGDTIGKASPEACVVSNRFFDLAQELRPDDAVQDEQLAPDEPEEKPVTEQSPAPAPRASRRRTKYQLTKAAAADLLSGPDTDAVIADIKNVRTFLLSLPEYRPQDVAVMSDLEATDKFRTDYAAVKFAGGNLILTKDRFDELVRLLTGTGAYYVPSAEADA